MIHLVETSQLFTLEQFEHAQLFEGCTHPWEALSRLEGYLKAQELGKMGVELPSTIHLVNPTLISIGEGTVVEPGAFIQGPCIIGKNCVIRHGAYIRGGVIVGDSCVIGHSTEVKHSVFFNHASAAHFNYVGDTILGSGANLGAGVKCANLRLDHLPIHVVVHGEKVNTGLKKLGAIIGDGAQVGCNCVINPGTVLGKNSFCFPCLNVYGFIPDHGKVRPAMKNIVE